MLKCTACGNEMESRTCSSCHGENLPDARFCCYCGKALKEPSAVKAGDDPYDLDSRILCSDENCIGIINEHGVCTECGRPHNFKE